MCTPGKVYSGCVLGSLCLHKENEREKLNILVVIIVRN